jgi:hypothetical protein
LTIAWLKTPEEITDAVMDGIEFAAWAYVLGRSVDRRLEGL